MRALNHVPRLSAVDGRQEVVLPPRRVALGAFPDWARAHLRPSDAVVLEATANAWHLSDLLVPLVATVTVAHAGAITLLATRTWHGADNILARSAVSRTTS